MSDDAWEVAAGVVRPYLFTRGRTRSETRTLAVEAMLSTTARAKAGTGTGPGAGAGTDGENEGDGVDRLSLLPPEQRQIVDLCREPKSVAEVAAKLATPLGVVRVLVADLADDALLEVSEREPDLASDVALLQRLIARVKSIPA
jgi:hypothetical protein